MADVTRRMFLRHLRGAPTTWVRHVVRGKVAHEGTGLSFWYRPLTAVISEVPADDRELPLLFHARTADFADVTVQATVTYRVSDPALAAARLDFSIDPNRGAWRGQPLDQVATLLAELAQQPALDLLARLPLTEALTAGVGAVRVAVSDALAGDARLTETGVRVVSARVVAVRPEPDLERAIAENELQNKIELSRREQQLVEQHGANARRQAELDAAAALAAAEGKSAAALVAARGAAERENVTAVAAAERTRLTAVAEADATRVRDEARAAGVRAVGTAEGEAETARMAAYRDLAPVVLQALALRELAGQLPEIGQLTITPDVVTDLFTRLGPAR